MCSISSPHSNWVYSSGWFSNLTFDQNEKAGIPFTLWQASWYKSQPSQQGFFHRQWVVAVAQSSALAIVRESFRFLKQAWAFYNSTKTKKREKIYGMVVWGVKKVFPLWKLYFQCIALGRFVPVSAFIICISIALKSPNRGSLTAVLIIVFI